MGENQSNFVALRSQFKRDFRRSILAASPGETQQPRRFEAGHGVLGLLTLLSAFELLGHRRGVSRQAGMIKRQLDRPADALFHVA